MTESQLEKTGVAYARNLGWLVRKASSPGRVGIHDQIHHKNGVTFYIEYKAPGKRASPKQRKFAKDLLAAGIPSRCCDSYAKAWDFINMMDAYASPANMSSLNILDISSFD